MIARALKLADAVVILLNSEKFDNLSNIEFDAERTKKPEYEIKDIKTLKVPVFAGQIETTIASRSEVEEDYHIQVGFLKKLQQDEIEEEDTDAFDGLSELVEITRDFFLMRKVSTDVDTLTCIAAVLLADGGSLYDIQAIDEENEFANVIDFTFRHIRRLR